MGTVDGIAALSPTKTCPGHGRFAFCVHTGSYAFIDFSRFLSVPVLQTQFQSVVFHLRETT